MKRLSEEQLKDMFARVVMPEHDAHRAATQARILASTTQSTSRSRQKSRRFVFRFALPGLALASAVIGVITVGSPALRSEFANRTNNTNSIIDSIVPQELIAESIANTFATSEGIRHIAFQTVREDTNMDGKHPGKKEITARTNQEYYIAPNAFTGYRKINGSSVQAEKSYRMTTLHADTQSIENCDIRIDIQNTRSIKSANADLATNEHVCNSSGIADYVGFAEKQPPLDIQDLSYNTDLDSEQMSFTTATPINPKDLGILTAEQGFVQYDSELVDAQNNIVFAPITLSAFGNVSGNIKAPEWNVPLNGRYKQSFVHALNTGYGKDSLRQSPERRFTEVQLQFVQLTPKAFDETRVEDGTYDPALFSAASQVFQMKFSDEWTLQGVNALTHAPEDITTFNAHRLAARKEIFSANSGETFFHHIAGGSAVLEQLRDVKPRVEGADYVYSFSQEWNAENPDLHLIETTEVRIDSETRLLTAIIERYDAPGAQQATVYTTTFETVKTINENPEEFFSVDRWKERAKEIINDPRY